MHGKFVIVAPDFKPMDGGVAEFSFQIATALQQRSLLEFVLSIVPQKTGDCPFPIVAHHTSLGGWRKRGDMPGDAITFFSKINTLRFHLGITTAFLKGTFRLLFLREPLVLFAFVNSVHAIRLIDFCRATGKRYVLLFHGQDLIRMHEAGRLKWLRSVIQGAQQILFNSNATRNLALDLLGTTGPQPYVLYPGIDFKDLGQTSASRELDRNVIRVATVCRLVRRKGIDIVIKALSLLCTRRPELRFTYSLAGTGPDEERLRLMASQYSEVDIHFLGFLSEAEKWTLLESSELFVMPNRSLDGRDFEGFGISFIEAIYAKNWVIGGRHGGAVEAIEEDVTGWTIPTDSENSVDYLADAIERYADQRIEFRDRVERASQQVIERFNFPRLADIWLNRSYQL